MRERLFLFHFLCSGRIQQRRCALEFFANLNVLRAYGFTESAFDAFVRAVTSKAFARPAVIAKHDLQIAEALIRIVRRKCVGNRDLLRAALQAILAARAGNGGDRFDHFARLADHLLFMRIERLEMIHGLQIIAHLFDAGHAG